LGKVANSVDTFSRSLDVEFEYLFVRIKICMGRVRSGYYEPESNFEGKKDDQ